MTQWTEMSGYETGVVMKKTIEPTSGMKGDESQRTSLVNTLQVACVALHPLATLASS